MVVLMAILASSAPGLVQASYAAGHAFDENFSILVENDPNGNSQELADIMLREANRYRDSIAMEWFDVLIPDGVGRTFINVSYAEDGVPGRGLTWPIDSERRTQHTIYITTNRELKELEVLFDVLKHEVCHTVMATRFPRNPLPVWADEGIACRYDDEARQQTRRNVIKWWKDTQFPSFWEIWQAEKIDAFDQVNYTIAGNLVDFLLTKGDKDDLISFARDVNADQYGYRNLEELHNAWIRWVRNEYE